MGKYIVVHAGRRDDYQVALALAEQGLLECLVTDFYAPYDHPLLGRMMRSLPAAIKSRLDKRYKPGLPSTLVKISLMSVFWQMLLSLTKNLKYSTKKDNALGYAARRYALRRGIPVLSMNTYAKAAFTDNPIRPKVLFQFHPHTTFVKNILEEEMALNPASVKSLSQEYEFSVPEEDLKNLTEEIHLADNIICASSVTANSVAAEGVPREKIAVIPYGVDAAKFPYKAREPWDGREPFRIVFIGSLNQRKGITYLLDALQDMPDTELHIIGRGIFDEEMLGRYNLDIKIHRNIPLEEMVSLLHGSHCFVLPSVVEGFGQVILEAMSTGIPVIASENTVAADIIRDGENGFVVPIRDAAAIRSRLELLRKEPEKTRGIGDAGRRTAQRLSWEQFRKEIVNYLSKLN